MKINDTNAYCFYVILVLHEKLIFFLIQFIFTKAKSWAANINKLKKIKQDLIILFIFLLIMVLYSFLFFVTCKLWIIRSLLERGSWMVSHWISHDFEFSFAKTCCPIKAREPSLCYYFTHSWGEINEFMSFTRTLVQTEWNQISWNFEA